MIIQLDDDSRIRGTDMCWQLEFWRGEKARWRAEKFFGTLAAALQHCVRRDIRTDSAEGVLECQSAAEKIVAKYAKLFDEVSK